MPPLNRFHEEPPGNTISIDVRRRQNNAFSQLEIPKSTTSIAQQQQQQQETIPKRSASSSSEETTRGAVRFSSEPSQIHSLLQRKDYSKQELYDCWYVASDLAKFREDIRTTVHLYQSDESRIDGKEYTLRGVENRVKKAASTTATALPPGSSSRRRSSPRKRAKYAVFLEQAFQKQWCIDSSSNDNDIIMAAESIAKAYSSVANDDAALDALNQGKLDQLEVSHCYKEDKENTNEETHSSDKPSSPSSFNDDWIRSVSTPDAADQHPPESDEQKVAGERILTTCLVHELAFEDKSDFNDSWLRGEVVMVKA